MPVGAAPVKPAARRWLLPAAGPGAGAPPLLGRALAARGLPAAAVGPFLAGGPVAHDPFALRDMAAAVEVIGASVGRGERLAVYGDYDADGVTACALLVRTLRAAGAEVRPYIPSREAEGYGLNAEALAELAAAGVATVVTVDCGTTAVAVAAGRPAGLRLVITDHHLPAHGPGGEVALAPAEALVNPRRPDDDYPFKGLAGVGVAYKLASALEQAGVVPAGTAEAQLCLVALGTVADMMPLVDENRALVRAGLARWRRDPPPGLRALAGLAGCPAGPTSSDLAFAIAPRINAAGRMEDAGTALACCLADDAAAGERAATELQALNGRRRASLQSAMAVARAAVEALDDRTAAVALGDPTFAAGVVGLVAGRLVEAFGRPAFVHSETGDEWRGSARGVPGLNVVDLLEACAPTLRRFGGHAAAGGYSLDPDPAAAAAFRARLLEVVAAARPAGPPERTFTVDAVCTLGDCTLERADELAALEPVGTGNPPALLAALDCRVEGTTAFGAAGDHLRVDLQDATGRAQAVTFNRPHLRPHLPLGRRIDCLFGLEADEWRGRRRVRLLLRDVRPHRPAA